MRAIKQYTCVYFLWLLLVIPFMSFTSTVALGDNLGDFPDDNEWQDGDEDFDDDFDDIDDDEVVGIDLLDYTYEVEYLCQDRDLTRKNCAKLSKALIDIAKVLPLLYDDENYIDEITRVAGGLKKLGKGKK
jgi:hypothetical protein